MKKYIFKMAIILFLIPLVSFGNDIIPKKHSKSKTIKRKYSVNSDATVKIKNKYGNINIETWDKNSVEIMVKITVKGSNLDVLEKRLRTINVEFDANPNMVSAETVIKNINDVWKFLSWNTLRRSRNINYQIDYFVKMPATNGVKLNNDYGSISLDELKGSADINCDYGKIIIGELYNKNNTINLDYCSMSTIDFIKSGTVNIDYSKLTIDKTDNIKVNSDYSTLNFGKLNNIIFNIDYGSITIDEANDIIGDTDYVNIRLGKISKNLHLKSNYGSIRIKEIIKGFENIDISGNYTNVKLGISPDSNFNFSVDFKYANFRFNEDELTLVKNIIKSSKKYYEGFYGSENSSSKLTIKSQYGNVTLKQQ